MLKDFTMFGSSFKTKTMAEEAKSQNQLTKFDQALASTKNVKDLFSLPDVKDRYIKNYQAVTNRTDGANRLEQERFAYMEILNDKPELKGAPMWSHFSAILKSATTGLSFRDGKLYVQPVKDREGNIVSLKVDPSPAGRREMLEMMPAIKSAPEAQVVMKGDKFVFDKLNQRIISHEATEKSATEDKLDNIVASYQRIIYTDGKIIDTVVPHADLVRAKAKSKVKNPDTDGVWLFNSEACKKVSTKRAFRLYHKYPDNVVHFDDKAGDDEDDDNGTNDVSHTDVTVAEPQYSQTSSGEPVNTDTGEVHQPTVIKEEKTKKPQRNLMAED
jgi:hypothetical protein